MTTLGLLPAPIKRLFERVDVTAAHPDLEAALGQWVRRRGSRMFPAAGDLRLADLETAADHLFILARSEAPDRDWELVSAGQAASAVLDPAGDWSPLGRLGNRRVAVHLRRLLGLMKETGEPIAATFAVRAGGRQEHYQVLVAPLSSDGREPDGALAGLVRD